ncbi:helix-turn-helix transcriptional regulator [Arthrobacter sp. LAPM80]|uniref:helix-turn-helix transcriptional regulator n=1 Tax=Arthrobacter sp. LAPM80 TaxID=3141788 RepID=UPI00398B4821
MRRERGRPGRPPQFGARDPDGRTPPCGDPWRLPAPAFDPDEEDLARAGGVSRQSIIAIENGRSNPTPKLAK